MMNLCYRNGLIPGMPLAGQPEPAPMPANWQNNIPNNIPARPAPKALLMRQLEQAVSYYVENGWYKYTYGEASTKEALAGKLSQAKRYFKDAYIVTFKNGKKQ